MSWKVWREGFVDGFTGQARLTAAYAFYWLGDGFYRLYDGVYALKNHEVMWAFNAYQWSMRVAHNIQGETRWGPWVKTPLPTPPAPQE